MSKKDWIALAIIVVIVFTIGFAIGHRICEMKYTGQDIITVYNQSK